MPVVERDDTDRLGLFANRVAFRERGDGNVYKRQRNQKERYDWQERWNWIIAPLRARVEHPNAMMKQQLGYRRVRYRGKERNAFDFALIVTACNIKKSLSLKKSA